MEYKKSAKDLAFDKERAKLLKVINNCNDLINLKNHEIDSLKRDVDVLKSECERLHDWVDRLLEFMDMSQYDLIRLIETSKKASDFLETMNRVSRITFIK